MPIELVACTLKVYDVSADNPGTLIIPEPAVDVVAEILPGVLIAVYDVIVDPPLYAGAV